MNKLLYIKIKEYMHRYETETYNPELHNLLKEVLKFENKRLGTSNIL